MRGRPEFVGLDLKATACYYPSMRAAERAFKLARPRSRLNSAPARAKPTQPLARAVPMTRAHNRSEIPMRRALVAILKECPAEGH